MGALKTPGSIRKTTEIRPNSAQASASTPLIQPVPNARAPASDSRSARNILRSLPMVRHPRLPRWHRVYPKMTLLWTRKRLPAIAEAHDAVAHQQVHNDEDGEDDKVNECGQGKELRAKAEAQGAPGNRRQGGNGAEVVERDLQVVEGQDEADEEGPEQTGP